MNLDLDQVIALVLLGASVLWLVSWVAVNQLTGPEHAMLAVFTKRGESRPGEESKSRPKLFARSSPWFLRCLAAAFLSAVYLWATS